MGARLKAIDNGCLIAVWGTELEMERSNAGRWIAVWGMAGCVVALTFLSIHKFLEHDPILQHQIGFTMNDIMVYLWPSSIFLMATDGIEGTARAYLFVTIAVLSNGLSYAVIGIVIWLVIAMSLRSRIRSKDLPH